MKDSKKTIDTSQIKILGDKISIDEWKVNESIIEKNPNVDTQLLRDFYQRFGGVIQKRKGANYRLSHPLGSNVVPGNRRK